MGFGKSPDGDARVLLGGKLADVGGATDFGGERCTRDFCVGAAALEKGVAVAFVSV